MMNAIYPSINLYTQLALLAENRPKECRPSFSAGAVLAPSSGITGAVSDCNFNVDGKLVIFCDFWVPLWLKEPELRRR